MRPEADSGIRTRGLDLGTVALCQLSYVRRRANRRCHGESNPDLRRDNPVSWPLEDGTVTHFRTFALAVQHGGRDSNPQPPVLETGALPIETNRRVDDHEASAGSRTPALVLTMDALCRLSYGSVSIREGEERTSPPGRAPAYGSRVPRGGCGRRPSGPPSPLANRSREPMTRVVKHAGPRGPAGVAHAGRSVSPEAPGVPRRGAETRSAPPPTCGRRGAFHCAWSDAGSLPPQRTPSRELCLILRVPPTADVRAGNPAEPIPATRTAEPAPEGRRAGPTDFHSASIRPPHGRRRARLRPDPGRHGRGGGHGCRMRHPEGGGGEGGGHHGALSFVGQGLGSSCFGTAGRRPRIQCKRKREARPTAPFPRRSRLADQSLGAWCCGDGLGRDSRFVRQQ
jgi:hypothetical protein